jgi:dephospho-CoA kinase
MNHLVAVVGLPGSGKSEVVVEAVAAGYTKVYFGALTLEKLTEEGLEGGEANERMMRERLRAEHGMAAFATLNIPKIEAGLAQGNVVIDGLYSWEEFLVLKGKFPSMECLAVWASPKVRHQRLATRPVRPLTEQEAYSRDVSQIENLHQAGPIAMADHLIVNEGISLPKLKNTARTILDGQKA